MRILTALLLALLVYVLPLAAVPHRIVVPGPWIGVASMVIVLLSQPPLSAVTMVRDSKDRGSGLGIFAAMVVAQLAAVLDFGYRNPAPPSLASQVTLVGVSVIVAGLVLRLWSIRTLGRFFTSTVSVQLGQTVVSTGPYRVLRHPSYTGAIIVSIGVTIVLASPLGAGIILLVVLPAYLYRISVEEKTLVRELGNAYDAYCERTWRLIPWVF